MPPILIPSCTKLIATQILVIAELNGRNDLVLSVCVFDMIFPNKQLLFQQNQLKLGTEA